MNYFQLKKNQNLADRTIKTIKLEERSCNMKNKKSREKEGLRGK
jgi:hypothetical protein